MSFLAAYLNSCSKFDMNIYNSLCIFFLLFTCQVESENNILEDGTLIDLCGASLLWRSASGLRHTPVSPKFIMSSLHLPSLYLLVVHPEKTVDVDKGIFICMVWQIIVLMTGYARFVVFYTSH